MRAHSEQYSSIIRAAAVATGGGAVRPLAFWQIASVFRCPVVGVCLTPAEQRKLVKKAGLLSASPTAFEIHEVLVSLTDEENPLSRRTDILLQKKYGQQAAELRRVNLFEFMKYWETSFASGDFAVSLWAAASRSNMPQALQRHIFGCVHMAMHDALEKGLRLEQQLRLFRTEREMAAEKFRSVKLNLARAHKEQRAARQESQQLVRACALLKAENSRLRNELTAFTGLSHTALGEKNQQLELALADHAERLRHAEAQATATERQLAVAVEEMETQRQLTLQLNTELCRVLESSSACEACSDACATCAACPRRVLIVGGMSRMEALYRQLVEGRGGVLDYHDGYLNGGAGKLEKCLQRADVVLCPVNCNSHGACLLVKNLCKKYKKTVHMMPNFSLTAVSRVISDMPPPEPMQSARVGV